jgi:hypothetical protein
MPDPLVIQLVGNVWDDLSKAVNTGLALGGDKTLADVIPVVTGKLTDTTWPSPVADAGPGLGQSLVRSSASSRTAFDYLHRYHLSYDALRSPDLDGLTAWAAAVRRFELTHVMKQVTQASRARSCTADAKSLSDVQPDGWGQLRCLAFTPEPDAIPVPGGLAAVDWDGPVKVGLRSADVGGVQALVFRLGGGPYVKRPADLALGWVPAADGSMDGLLSVDLVLTGQLELVNVTKTTVTAITIVAGHAVP